MVFGAATAKAVARASAVVAAARRIVFCMAGLLDSDRGDFDGLDHVAHVAGRLPDRRGRLADAVAAPGAAAHVVDAGPVRREGERELAERIAAQVLAERRAAPGLTAV